MENIRLLIWDLDDTFWNGTISEGSIQIPEEHIAIVKELTSRGIINSIVSKNDYEIVKNKLEEIGLWEYFVFPQIAWLPKGQLIKNLIENIQLREESILFIDDNHLNLKEAKFYNTKLNTENPSFIKNILENKSFIGKEDFKHERLSHYKILEKKQIEKNKFSENTEFLKQSEIWVQYVSGIMNYKYRVHELINRTNQLNYTKKRISLEELERLFIDKKSYECKVISVYDKYGDYGIVGFVCIDKKTKKAEHFLFSCRVINLGVEQFVYADFNYPEIDIIDDVITPITNCEKPDWIKLNYNNYENKNNKSEFNKKILLRGGCDLLQMENYLHYEGIDTVNEMNYSLANNISIHREHTELLIQSQSLTQGVKEQVAKENPFLDLGAFKTKVFEENYDILVYSLLMDYTQELYTHKEKNVTVPFGGYYNVFEINNIELENKYKSKKIECLDESFFENFKNAYEYKGKIDEKNFKKNLTYLRNNTKVPIIFINGAEVGNEHINEVGSLKRHKIMNGYLDEFIKENNNVYLLDLRNIVIDKDCTTDNIRHYKRHIYLKMAKELINIIKKL